MTKRFYTKESYDLKFKVVCPNCGRKWDKSWLKLFLNGKCLKCQRTDKF